MSSIPSIESLRPTAWRPLRVGTLVGLRWLAIGGQLVGVLFVELGLGYPLPLVPCLLVIAVSVVVNLGLTFRIGGGLRPQPRYPAVQLAYDLLQLGALLALTGGLQNPFSLLLLAPVSVSATTLSQRATFLLAGLATIVASVVSMWHLPLPWDPETYIVFDRVYVVGIWVSLVCGVVFIAAYTNRVALEARQLADALAATELALSRHEQLSALDGLAAAAAHELGTPLSTIALAAKEMKAEVEPGPLADDIDLIISQAARCRAILGKLRNLGADDGNPFAAVPLGDLIAEVAKPHEQRGRRIETQIGRFDGPEPVIQRHVALLYGLGNLVENATHFARELVTVEYGWDDERVSVTVVDDGPGFPPEMLARLGEPYLNTRAREVAGSTETGGGLGLGIFIAKTLLERTGATVGFENVSALGRARVKIVWPRHAVSTRTL
ncbi:MAG: ActS/PrrB/RegB family redox-sensitive histidine kinase [Devosia sp.]|nr:ActS/PrrB/RegB family redox-sensitive histidine kinase [Devosia sp.]